MHALSSNHALASRLFPFGFDDGRKPVSGQTVLSGEMGQKVAGMFIPPDTALNASFTTDTFGHIGQYAFLFGWIV